jgi:hypothetical protein
MLNKSICKLYYGKTLSKNKSHGTSNDISIKWEMTILYINYIAI